jgi:hypothetical protein
VETPEAFYVRKPDQNNRILFTLTKHLCAKEIPPTRPCVSSKPAALSSSRDSCRNVACPSEPTSCSRRQGRRRTSNSRRGSRTLLRTFSVCRLPVSGRPVFSETLA